ncbi:aldo/keto reductase [Streptosporangium sp. 'caverna']|uniref:aldo/keto reductase n=1 Tax=Streptosporangium sp. 'caverna' TaxID=2202249 RepID=UPI000D7DEA67|nr:aldo/keto reductase [Streptosporangium sp. 'caverna']AWS43684.1 aldo/keto reductase [Streptosporangium sp. 'caverna']
MRYRLLGRTGLRVSEVFLGAMTFGEEQIGASPQEARRILDLYGEAGGNLIDTANFYSGGRSETILGELLTGCRDRFVVASKYTVSRNGGDPNAAGSHRKNLTLSLESSLRRLGTDYLDLYWVNLWDRHTPIEETMRALDDAVRAGKILYVGMSDAPAWVISHANTLAEWRGWTPFAAIQAPYSLLNRDIERELLPMAQAFGLTVAAWGPLAHGVLSGKFDPAAEPRESTRISARSLGAREHAVAQAVREVADEIGATPAQVAIAWTRARSRAVHPILGARTAEQLKDTLGALGLTLPDHAVRRLEAATDFTLGFPGDFLAQADPAVFGESAVRLDGRRLP